MMYPMRKFYIQTENGYVSFYESNFDSINGKVINNYKVEFSYLHKHIFRSVTKKQHKQIVLLAKKIGGKLIEIEEEE